MASRALPRRSTSARSAARPIAFQQDEARAALRGLLVDRHQLHQRSARAPGPRTGNPARFDSVAHPLDVVSAQWTHAAHDSSAAITMPAATASPCSQSPYPAPASMAWPKVWPKLSSARWPGFALVVGDDARLQLAAAPHGVDQSARGRAPAVFSTFASSQSDERRIEREAVLDHLGEAGAQLAVGQRVEGGDVRDHRPRLVERADHVLAARVVDRGLAADRGVDLREQRGRHLHERRRRAGRPPRRIRPGRRPRRRPARRPRVSRPSARRAGRRTPAPASASSLPARRRRITTSATRAPC